MQSSDISGKNLDNPSLAHDLRVLFTAFSSRWLLIVAVMAASLALAVGFVWMTPPSYTSSADIFVDPRARDLAGLDVSPSGLGTSSQGADTGLVESQLALLTSRSALTALIEQAGLDTDPEFLGGTGRGPVSALKDLAKTLIYGPNAESYLQQGTPVEQAMDRLSRAITVERVGQTYVINISATTGSAQRSAELANGLAEIYISGGQSAADQSALQTAESLEQRLFELADVSAASQQAMQDYRQKSGLVGSQGVLVDEQQLADLNTRVTEAVVATEQARAAVEEVRTAGTTSSSTLSSELIGQLRVQIEQARSEENTLAGVYGDRHPTLQSARETRISLENALQAEMVRVLARAESDYSKALETQAALKTLLAEYEQKRAASEQASAGLRELEQIATQDRDLYESFLLRAKQAREQVALPSTTARIISAAIPAAQPSGPKVALVLAAGLLGGATLGFGLAWLLYMLFGVPQPKQRGVRKTVPEPVADRVPPAPPRAVPQPVDTVKSAAAQIRAARPPSQLRRLARLDS